MSLLDLTPKPTTLPNGIVLNHVRAGAGPTMIFVHGAMGDWRAAAPQWETFVTSFDCISYSRRYSHPNPNPMTSRQHNALVDAEDLEGLMDALGVVQAILVGSSYGGFTALAMALRAPERVMAVVSVEAPMMRYAQRTQDGAAIAKAFREAAARPAQEAFERGDDRTGVMILTGGIIGKKADDIPAHVLDRRMQNAKAARSLALSDDEFPLLDDTALAGLQMPVLLMSGAQTTPIHATIFASVCSAMPKAKVRIVDGSGHSVSQQKPDVFNAEVLQFLTESGLLVSRQTALAAREPANP